MIPPCKNAPRNSPQPRQGFALIMAMAMIALVAAAFVVLSQLAAADAKRTRRLDEEAQLTQLILAGLRRAATNLGRAPGAPISIPLPPELTDADLTMTFEPADNSRTKAILTARVGTSKRQETLLLDP